MINQITQVRLLDGQTVAIVDWEHRPLYSTADIFSGFSDPTLTLFSYTDGGTVTSTANLTTKRQATLRDTNLSSDGGLPATEEFLCYGLAFEVFQVVGSAAGPTSTPYSLLGNPNPTAANMAILHRVFVAQLNVSQKTYFQAGFGYFLAGFGPVVGGAIAAATSRTFASNGQQGHHAEHNAQIPVHIGGGEEFSVTLENPTGDVTNFVDEAGATLATAILQARCYLNGLWKRPVG